MLFPPIGCPVGFMPWEQTRSFGNDSTTRNGYILVHVVWPMFNAPTGLNIHRGSQHGLTTVI